MNFKRSWGDFFLHEALVSQPLSRDDLDAARVAGWLTLAASACVLLVTAAAADVRAAALCGLGVLVLVQKVAERFASLRPVNSTGSARVAQLCRLYPQLQRQHALCAVAGRALTAGELKALEDRAEALARSLDRLTGHSSRRGA